MKMNFATTSQEIDAARMHHAALRADAAASQPFRATGGIDKDPSAIVPLGRRAHDIESMPPTPENLEVFICEILRNFGPRLGTQKGRCIKLPNGFEIISEGLRPHGPDEADSPSFKIKPANDPGYVTVFEREPRTPYQQRFNATYTAHSQAGPFNVRLIGQRQQQEVLIRAIRNVAALSTTPVAMGPVLVSET